MSLYKVLQFRTNLGETLVAAFLGGGSMAFFPRVEAQFHAGFNLAATTWLMIVAIAGLAGALIGSTASLRLNRALSQGFEQLSCDLLARIDQSLQYRNAHPPIRPEVVPHSEPVLKKETVECRRDRVQIPIS
jgi:hypothetical protein